MNAGAGGDSGGMRPGAGGGLTISAGAGGAASTEVFAAQAGGNAAVYGGSGGAGSATAAGGNGGSVSIIGGSAGSSGGAGGGGGGGCYITAADGAAGTAAATTGRTGGTITITSGSGGAAYGTGDNNGGSSGSIRLICGTYGSKNAGGNDGSQGKLVIQPTSILGSVSGGAVTVNAIHGRITVSNSEHNATITVTNPVVTSSSTIILTMRSTADADSAAVPLVKTQTSGAFTMFVPLTVAGCYVYFFIIN